MGVLNARVGTDSVMWGSVIGRHAEEGRNEGWELLLRFCAANEMLGANMGVSGQRVEEHHQLFPGEKGQSGEGKRC